jgi:hypothetical protein
MKLGFMLGCGTSTLSFFRERSKVYITNKNSEMVRQIIDAMLSVTNFCHMAFSGYILSLTKLSQLVLNYHTITFIGEVILEMF